MNARPMPAKSYEKIEEIIDLETPDNTGWWVVYYDPDGTSYDAIGPFDSCKEATDVHEGCGEEPDLCRAMASWPHAGDADPDHLREDRDERRALAREDAEPETFRGYLAEAPVWS